MADEKPAVDVPSYRRSRLFKHWQLLEAQDIWRYTFVAPHRNRIIALAQESQIPGNFDDLISRLEHVITDYEDHKEYLANNMSKGGIAEQINDLTEAILALEKALAAQRVGTRRELAPYLLGEETPSRPPLDPFAPQEMDELERRLCHSFDTLDSIRKAGETYLSKTIGKRSGRQPLIARDRLLANMAHALYQVTNQMDLIGTGEKSPFPKLIDICLDAVGETLPGERQRIIGNAVEAFTGEIADGTSTTFMGAIIKAK